MLFTTLLSVIDEPFVANNLSITKGRSRLNTTKRNKSLDNVGLNETTYQEEFKVDLKKCVLYINGLKSPIILSKN